MGDDAIGERFKRASTAERLEMVADDTLATSLKEALGTPVFDDLRRLAASYKPKKGTLGASTPKNVVFVPGIMGSLLDNRSKGGVWWIDARTIRKVKGLRLAPDGLTDAGTDDRIRAFNVDTSYDPFLTAALARTDIGVETFPFDWRKPLAASAAALRDLVLSLPAENGGQKVHLIAHSMGGLMVRTALMLHGPEMWPVVGKVVFVGTPHFGSPAIAGYLKNHLWGFDFLALLGAFLDRDTFRSMWGVLSMLPAPVGVYPGQRGAQADYDTHPCVNFDPYRVDSWKLGLDSTEEANLQTVLDGAASAHRDLWAAHRSLSQEQRDRMLVIAGVGYKTLFRLAYKSRFFGAWEHADKVTDRKPGNVDREGDGRVPLASAALDWVPIRYVKGVHGDLMNVPAVQKDVFAFLGGKDLRLPSTPKGALAANLSGDGRSSSPALNGSPEASVAGDDPGLWSDEAIEPARLEQLKADVEQGRLPGIERVRIL